MYALTRCPLAGCSASTNGASVRPLLRNCPARHISGPARGRTIGHCSQDDIEAARESWSYALHSEAHENLPMPSRSEVSVPSSSQEDLFNSLRQNKFWVASQPPVNLLTAGPAMLQRVPEVHVILFGMDNQEQEGIYSLKALGPDGLPQETIIAFESQEDAERYAGLLEVTMDPHMPRVCSILAAEIVEFCHDREYDCRLESRGSLLMPPDYNVGLTDWERSFKLRSGNFAVLEIDPHAEGVSQEASVTWGISQALQQPSQHAHTMQPYASSMAPAELDAIRSQLEALLPPPEEGPNLEEGQ